MKSNNSITGGGHLLPEYYDEWSDTIAASPALVKENTGIDLHAMSPQHETDFASCGTTEPCNGNYDTTVFTGQEYADFAPVVGPKLHALNPPVKMMSPEASEWIHVWSNESGCCSEPGGEGSSDPLIVDGVAVAQPLDGRVELRRGPVQVQVGALDRISNGLLVCGAGVDSRARHWLAPCPRDLASRMGVRTMIRKLPTGIARTLALPAGGGSCERFERTVPGGEYRVRSGRRSRGAAHEHYLVPMRALLGG